mgnify:CR=1 FL=1
MDIRGLKYFISAAECLNFTRAAKECFITQTAMSQHIANMEKELGFQLLRADESRGSQLRQRRTPQPEPFQRRRRQRGGSRAQLYRRADLHVSPALLQNALPHHKAHGQPDLSALYGGPAASRRM